MPDDSTLKGFKGKEFWKKEFKIPKLGVNEEFLGLKLKIGVFLNFVFELTDVEFHIPIGFDYFKGYQISASKYYEITPTTVSDSEWEINFNQLPPSDSVKDVFKALLETYFTATLQFRPYLSLDFDINIIKTSLECGLKFPFVFKFSLDSDVEIPIVMYFAFQGIKYKNYDLIEEKEHEIELFMHSFPEFCIGKRKVIQTDPDSIDEDHFESFYITNDEIYETATNHIRKQVFVELLDKNNELIQSYGYPMTTYSSEKTSKDRKIMLFKNDMTKRVDGIRWSINYIDPTSNEYTTSTGTFYKKISDLTFDENNQVSFDVQIHLKSGDDSDITYMKATVEEVPMFLEAEPYHRKTQKVATYIINTFKNNFTLLTITEDGNRLVDTDSKLYSGYSLDERLFEKALFDITANNLYAKITETNTTEENARFELDFIICYEIDGQAVEKVVCTFVSPKLKQGEDVYTSETSYSLINRAFYAPKGWSFKINCIVYHTDGAEDQVNEAFGKYDDIDEFPIFINLGSSIKIGLSFGAIMFPLVVETSYSNPYPLAEVLITQLNMDDFIYNTTADYLHDIRFSLQSYEKLKILRFHVSDEYRQSKLYITFSKSTYKTQFMSDNVYVLDDFHGIVDVNGQEFVDVLVGINGKVTSIEMELFYIRTQEEGLIISLEGNKMKLVPKIGNALMIPFFYGYTSIFLHIVDGTLTDPVKYATTQRIFGNFTFLTLALIEDKEVDFIVYLTTYGIGYEEPFITMNFTNYQPLIDRNGYFEYTVRASNGKSIRYDMGGKNSTVPLVENKAVINITDVSKPITFTAICENSSGMACEITYPAPKSTGFHLIHYPNRDGISTTGRGFLSEIIPVEEGKSFVYSKTYLGSIEKVREYSVEPVKISLKIIDQKDVNVMGMERVRRICFVDESDNKVPFSRKYVDEHLFDLLDILGIDENVDFNYLTTDEDGCFVFDPKYIVSNDLKAVPKEACDLNLAENVTDVDANGVLFEPGGKEKGSSKTTTIIIVVVVIVVVVIVIIVVVYVIKKKKKKIQNNNSVGQNVSSENNGDNNNLDDIKDQENSGQEDNNN